MRRGGVRWAVALILSVYMTLCAPGASAYAQSSNQEPIRILFINPAPPEDLHWSIVTSMMRAAAADLGVELDVQHAFHSGQYTLKYAALAAKAARKPHYIIFRNVDRIAIEVFKLTQAAGIHTLTIDAPLEEAELKLLGGPRQKVPTWLGQVVPNFLTASESLGKVLIQDIDRRGFKGLIDIVAMTGPDADIGSQVRLFGLKRGVQAFKNARILHAFPSNWDVKSADREAYKAFRYAAKVPVWWAADDNIGLGVINVLRNTHRKLGSDTLLGAFNWTQPMLTALVQNQVQYVAGGGFVQGAAALILAHDHARGRDFADQGLNYTMELAILHRNNIASVGRVMISDAWDRIDFRRFSRVTNPALTQYDFTVNSYLRAVLGQ